MNTAVDFAVAGGGITGLACALRLRSLEPSARIVLLEAEPTIGGKISGTRAGGCNIDGGPDLFVASKLEGTRLFRHLELGSRVIPVNPGRLPTFQRRGNSLENLAGVLTDGLMTMPGGMIELVEKVADALRPSVEIRTSWAVDSVQREGEDFIVDGANGDRIIAHALVIALPAPECARVLERVARVAAIAASHVRYQPMTTVSMAWRAADVELPLAGTGYIIPGAPGGSMSACTWTSSKIPSRAPRDVVLLRGYCRTADEEAAAAMVLHEVRTTLGVTAMPLFTRSFSWQHALPVYASDHALIVELVEDATDALGAMGIAGAAFHGVGIGDCIASGERAAQKAVSRLRPGVATRGAS